MVLGKSYSSRGAHTLKIRGRRSFFMHSFFTHIKKGEGIFFKHVKLRRETVKREMKRAALK